jgi:hypothetical protein
VLCRSVALPSRDLKSRVYECDVEKDVGDKHEQELVVTRDQFPFSTILAATSKMPDRNSHHDSALPEARDITRKQLNTKYRWVDAPHPVGF